MYSIQELAAALKAARIAQGLSQRALSAKTGLTQAHISRIENGEVDVQLSNLITLARALDHDVLLLPRRSLPAVAAVVRGGTRGDARPAYRLDEDAADG